jgi:hypothetical protein
LKKRPKQSSLDFDSLLDENSWYDLWHTHFDWDGDGNHGIEARRPFLQELFRVFGLIQNRVSNWKRPTQVWVVILEKDASQDAVYLHTPNPNQNNFPYSFEGVNWGAEPPTWLKEFIDPNQHEVGRSIYNSVEIIWIRSTKI